MAASHTHIQDISDDLLASILWRVDDHIFCQCHFDTLLASSWPRPRGIYTDPRQLFRQENRTPFPSLPASSDAAHNLLIAAVCRPWRRIAQRHVSSLFVREGRSVPLQDLTHAVRCFPRLSRLHLCVGSVATLTDAFLSHLASACPMLTSLHVGLNITHISNSGEDPQDLHPVTETGLDRFFSHCTRLEELTVHCLHPETILPPSFFQLRNLRSLFLTDPSALKSPHLTNLSSLATLTIQTESLDTECLRALVPLASTLTSLSFGIETYIPGPSPFPFALLSSLRSLEFLEHGPRVTSAFPSGFPLRFLKRLLISGCSAEERFPEDIGQIFPCLEELSISCCSWLAELPVDFTSLTCLHTLEISESYVLELPENFGQLPALKSLVLRSLQQLVLLPDSFSQLSSLETLCMFECTALRHLPAGFSSLPALKSLCLAELFDLTLPDDFGRLSSLESLLLIGNHAQRLLPPTFTQLSSLTRLELDQCVIPELPYGMDKMTGLRELYMNMCNNDTEIPGFITALTRLEVLRIKDCSALAAAPRRLSSLVRLRELELVGCHQLRAPLLSLPPSIETLTLETYEPLNPLLTYQLSVPLPTSLQASPLPEVSMLSRLRRLSLTAADAASGAEGMSVGRSLSQLTRLDLSLARGLQELPFSLMYLSCLRKLNIYDAGGIRVLPVFLGYVLGELRELRIGKAEALEELPASVTLLTQLTSLTVHAPKLVSLPGGIGALSRVRRLDLSGCSALTELPASLTQMVCLTSLDVSCSSIRSLPSGFARLSMLKSLNVHGCKQLEGLPEDITELELLGRLDVSGCPQLLDAGGHVQPCGLDGMYGLTIEYGQ